MPSPITVSADIHASRDNSRMRLKASYSKPPGGKAFCRSCKSQKPSKHHCRIFTSPWGNEETQKLIDILNSYGVKATFFLVGQWADKYPESVQALADAGMEIGDHSDTHPHMAKLSKKQIIDEVSLCAGKIKAITGQDVKLFRCPYGEYDDEVITTIRDMGIYPIQWDVEPPRTEERPRRRAGRDTLGRMAKNYQLYGRKMSFPGGGRELTFRFAV